MALALAGVVAAMLGVGHAPVAAVTSPDPSSAVAQMRAKLLQSLNGRWDRQDGNCSSPMTLAMSTGSDGVARLTLTSQSHDSPPKTLTRTGQVIAADRGAVVTRETTPDASGQRQQWEYRPNGASR